MITESIKIEILSVEDARCHALESKDAAALREVLDSSFTYIHANGRVQHRDDYVEEVVEGTTELADFEHLDTELRAFGECVVMTGELKHARVDDGARREFTFRYTSIWSRDPKGWLLALWHNTKVT